MDSPGSGKSSLSARQIVRHLIESRQPEGQESDGRARTAAVACNDLYRGLSRWIGADGCHALFTRALAQARTGSATLEQLQLRPGAVPYVEGVGESVSSHGDTAVADSLQSMLVGIVELLERLIGGEMATKLIERSIVSPTRRDATSNDRQEEM